MYNSDYRERNIAEKGIHLFGEIRLEEGGERMTRI